MSSLKEVSGKTASQSVSGETAPSAYEDILARRWQRRRVTLTVLAALAGVVLALWLGRALKAREQGYLKAVFKGSAARWGDSLQRVVADRVGKVSTTVAFIRSSDINDRKDFHKFVTQLLKNVSSVEMLAWTPRIPAARRSAHEEAVRKEGLSKYTISDRDDRGRRFAAGSREEYYPILFAEPFSKNESLLGLDLESDAACRAAMRQAKASRCPAVAVYTAISLNKTGDHVLFVVEPARYESVASKIAKRPADQPETEGFVLGVLRMEAIGLKWLSLPGLNLPPGIDVYISADGKSLASLRTGSPPRPLQDTDASSTIAPAEPPIGGALASEAIEVGGTSFKLVYVAPAHYIADCGTWKPMIATLTGLLITGLVVGYFWLLTGRMASVERQVADRWLELRERERYIRHLVDNTGDAIFLRNEQGKIYDINKRACDSLGYSREELLSMTAADVELPVGAEDSGPTVKRAAEDYSQNFESLYRRKDGTTFPVEVHLTSVGSVAYPLILAIVRDITDRKQAEKAVADVAQPSADVLDLSHGTAQQLAAALDRFQTADRLHDSDPETAQKMFDEGVRLLRELRGESRGQVVADR
jgi:PAS domain S-box-containing protein